LDSTASVLEHIFLDYTATIVERVLDMPLVDTSAEALQKASQTANTTDRSGMAAFTFSQAPPLRMDQFLFALRNQPQHYDRAKEIWRSVLQNQEAKGGAGGGTKKKATSITATGPGGP
jgi:hypothetical protein